MNKIFTLNRKTVNQKVLSFEYAVRGAQALRADELKTQLAKLPNSLPFKNVVACNIGNPQQLGQPPLTFYRQVSALVEYPPLMKETKIFPRDTIVRASELLASMGGSVGAYSHSQGIPLIRQRIADFISNRDGHPSNPQDIFLTAGASPGVQTIMQTVIAHENVGIYVPIPQYPLYTASIALFGGVVVPYYLDEAKDWSVSKEELERGCREARKTNPKLDIRALCVINPGNPTGQCLSIESMRSIIEYCKTERLVLLADEVYQENIYTPTLPFHSFKKVLKSMGKEYDSVELISFHSISKGMIGECGRRGGYYECVNIDNDVKDLFYKIASVSLCPPVQGQVMIEMMVNPPQVGDPSYELFTAEKSKIYESLKRRAIKLTDAFNSMEGVSCNTAQGSMYLFPSITLSEKSIAAAKTQGVEPCALYSMYRRINRREMLNATGVCVVPGSGFGQIKGTYHFRSTFLPAEEVSCVF